MVRFYYAKTIRIRDRLRNIAMKINITCDWSKYKKVNNMKRLGQGPFWTWWIIEIMVKTDLIPVVEGFTFKVRRIREWNKNPIVHDNGFPDRRINGYDESIIRGNWTKVADELPSIFTIMYSLSIRLFFHHQLLCVNYVGYLCRQTTANISNLR